VNALVIGFGSIGARHARILTELGCHTAVVSRRPVDFGVTYSSLAEALVSESPDYVVVANETKAHYETLKLLTTLGYTGSVLVEKPLFNQYNELPSNLFRTFSVAYNLRFHPIVRRVKSLLKGDKILSVQAYVGQYLPAWRPATDYRNSYSASIELGGGALRDISHELDYLVWMLDGWKQVAAVGGHYSTLEIDSDDVFSIMLETTACPVVSLQMNYLDRIGRRFVIINTSNHTIEADLVKGTVTVDSDCESFSLERDLTYREMHKAMFAGDEEIICSLSEGLEVMRLIEAAELASRNKEWVKR
jgi:predicted dehydrogenase